MWTRPKGRRAAILLFQLLCSEISRWISPQFQQLQGSGVACFRLLLLGLSLLSRIRMKMEVTYLPILIFPSSCKKGKKKSDLCNPYGWLNVSQHASVYIRSQLVEPVKVHLDTNLLHSFLWTWRVKGALKIFYNLLRLYNYFGQYFVNSVSTSPLLRACDVPKNHFFFPWLCQIQRWLKDCFTANCPKSYELFWQKENKFN